VLDFIAGTFHVPDPSETSPIPPEFLPSRGSPGASEFPHGRIHYLGTVSRYYRALLEKKTLDLAKSPYLVE
jgi:hypothetical protein